MICTIHGGSIFITAIITCSMYTKVHYQPCAIRVPSGHSSSPPFTGIDRPSAFSSSFPSSDHMCLQVFKLHHLFILSQPTTHSPSNNTTNTYSMRLPVLKFMIPNIHINIFQFIGTWQMLEFPIRPRLSISFARVLCELETRDRARQT
jgi:hypothetical protein